MWQILEYIIEKTKEWGIKQKEMLFDFCEKLYSIDDYERMEKEYCGLNEIDISLDKN
jgi:hypothetical protein